MAASPLSPPDERHSPVVENYLKALHALAARHGGDVSTGQLAEALGVSGASVTSMLKRLAEQGLVQHRPYRGVLLTERGERAALEVLRHHRLLELFLHRALGMPLHEVHEEAERLEHAMSERLESHIAAWLGDPTHNPYGDPIPALSGQLPQRAEWPLTALAPGERGRIARVPEGSTLLQALVNWGLVPEAEVQVLANSAELGTLTLLTEKKEEFSISLEKASQIFIHEPEREAQP